METHELSMIQLLPFKNNVQITNQNLTFFIQETACVQLVIQVIRSQEIKMYI